MLALCWVWKIHIKASPKKKKLLFVNISASKNNYNKVSADEYQLTTKTAGTLLDTSPAHIFPPHTKLFKKIVF